MRAVNNRNFPRARSAHQNTIMRTGQKSVITAVLCGQALAICLAQTAPQQSVVAGTSSGKTSSAKTSTAHPRSNEHLLTQDDGLAVISAALDTQRHFGSEHDCSHLVHAIYQKAGFSYAYASSDDIYDGVEGFRRVYHPQTGDLVVWHGHVGIVVRPSRHVFFSFLTAGPGTDNYHSAYWVGRGEPRFYRYDKGHPCPGCPVRTAMQRSR
jgi:cell wall-associated NlpC family hydrolase